MDFSSFKDLESVKLKATYNIEIGNRKIEPGEVIAYFDKLQIAGFNEVTDFVAAQGGFGNAMRVIWETTKQVNVGFSQGVFSSEQFALLANSRLFDKSPNQRVRITMREELESDENGVITCKYEPVQNIFIYKKETGEKLEFTQDELELTIEEPFTDVIVDYEFFYNNAAQDVVIGRRLLGGFVELEGFTRVKDDTTGNVVTGLLRIPKLRLMSDVSIRLGAQANPVVANFTGIAVPTGSKGNTYVMEFCYLSNDVMSDL